MGNCVSTERLWFVVHWSQQPPVSFQKPKRSRFIDLSEGRIATLSVTISAASLLWPALMGGCVIVGFD